jgi:heme exporter protein CcmD
MDFTASYVTYVLLSYAVSALVLGGLALYILRSDRAVQRELKSRDKAKSAESFKS